MWLVRISYSDDNQCLCGISTRCIVLAPTIQHWLHCYILFWVFVIFPLQNKRFSTISNIYHLVFFAAITIFIHLIVQDEVASTKWKSESIRISKKDRQHNGQHKFIFYLHDLLLVNVFWTWISLKHWSCDVKQQSVNTTSVCSPDSKTQSRKQEYHVYIWNMSVIGWY